ncbi:MAG: mechanosensitive ion channel [Rickettsiales bacterium]|nr:mechanosensitive ion channel [Rickettsiales bacterium]
MLLRSQKTIKRLSIMLKWIALLGLAAIIILAILGYHEPIVRMLDSEEVSFQIGKVTLTPYLILKGLFALIVLFWLAGVVSAFGERQIQNISALRASNRALIIKVVQISVYFISFLIALDILGIDLTALAVFSGAIGIGIGFGLQKITSNFISGLILLFEKSIEEDDLVELEDGTFGFVRHTGARYTLVETFNGKEIMIPNEDFITSKVVNWTFSNTFGRVEIPIGVSYQSDIEKAYTLILEAAGEHPRCSRKNTPTCYLREFADSSVNFLLFMWVDDVREGRYDVQSDVMFNIWRKFREHNIEIPFPQRDLHLRNAAPLKVQLEKSISPEKS